MKKLGSLIAQAGICLLVLSFTAPAQRSFTAINVPVTENFDRLANSGSSNPFANNVTIVGVYSSQTSYIANAGSEPTGAQYSFGSFGSTDRAFGSVASGATSPILYGIVFRNNTGSTITSLDISYIGEQWRRANNLNQHSLTVDYRVAVGITNLTAGTFTAVPAFNFAGPVFSTGTATALDGNLAQNRVSINGTLPISIPSGSDILIRWTDVDDGGFDHGLAIDELSVTPRGASPGVVQFTLDEYSGLENGGVITVSARRTGASGGAISVDYGEQVVVGTRTGKARNVRPELREEFKRWLENDVTSILINKPDTVSYRDNGDGTMTFEGDPEGTVRSSLPMAWMGQITAIGRRSVRDPGYVDVTEIPESFKNGIPPERYHEFFSDTPTFGDARAITRRDDLRSEISDLRSKNALGGGTATGGASCAFEGVDYITPSGTLNWADGDSADKTFNITICPDSDFEPDETFTIELTNPTGGATLGMPSNATVTILNDDPEPVVPIVVTTTGDDGDANPGDGSCATAGGECTLRAAVEEANALPGEQIIEFQLTGLGVPDVITLTSGTEIAITGDVIINGPGANLLTIDGGPGSNRIFSVNNVSTQISGLTLTGGNGAGAVSTSTGGAIYGTGNLVVDSVVFTGNGSSGTFGGAIGLRTGTHTISNSTFFSNSGSGCGAIVSSMNSNLSIVNSTFSGNSIGSDGAGGAICNQGLSLTISNSTITGNSNLAFGGGGIFSSTGITTIRSSVVAGNTAPNQPEIWFLGGIFVSDGFNLIGDSAGDSTTTGNAIIYQSTDIVDTPPLLGPLQNNGGPTPTHRPSALSPVIDAGDSFGLMTDQRGFARVFDFTTIANVGDGADIGAFENLGPSQAAIEVSGRVMTAGGMPIRGAKLTVHGAAFTEPRTFVSGSMGTFELAGLRAGETYFIHITAGRFTFAEPWITFNALDSINDMEIIGVPQF